MRSISLSAAALSRWRYLGLALLGAIWILSLIPLGGAPRFPGGDKLHHALAYGALMFAWSFATPREAVRLRLAIGFCMMGLLIEGLQHLTPYRFFEWEDALANALGILFGWCGAWLAIRLVGNYQRSAG